MRHWFSYRKFNNFPKFHAPGIRLEPSAAGLQVTNFSLGDIQNPTRFFQRKPVAGIFVADFLKEVEYDFMKVGHSLEHCVKHLLVDCYDFDSKLDLVGL